MKLKTAAKRSFETTSKQIKRSGWLAWASIVVMALAFFIATTFIMVAYTSNLFLKSIENKPHIYVFFNAGTPEAEIKELNDKWMGMGEVASIEYTNEEGALSEFKDVQQRTNPRVAGVIRSSVLPPSLGIRLHSIQDADKLIELVQQEKEANENIFDVRFSKETIDTIKTLFYWVRIAGGVIMSMLLIVIFFFTLLTVEFRTYNRAEEISIMQLVGGSLWFIRSPFILEGAFYGLIGSFISTSILYIIGIVIFGLNRDTSAVNFVINFLGGLQWPNLTVVHAVVIYIGMLLLGGIVGGLNSLIAIKRYIY